MILFIDNYDSFVYNLARYVGLTGYERKVVRNDAITLDEIERLNPFAIILSPGPCTPMEAGITNDIIAHLSERFPILGVCLGHQAIGHVLGAKVTRAPQPIHGKASIITHNGTGLFENLPPSFKVGRYHSLIVENNDPKITGLNVMAQTADGINMAMQHETRPLYGVQFHPESVLTEHGHILIENFIKCAADWHAQKESKCTALSMINL
jgi:anthranilate synthase/aminodeoxychorismate synthase-like glutamine amidotransferase